jgi:hypothetical protein
MKSLVANFCMKLREGRILSPRRVRRRGAASRPRNGSAMCTSPSVKLLVNQKKKEKKRHFATNKRVPLDKKRQLRASCRRRLYDTDAFLTETSHMSLSRGSSFQSRKAYISMLVSYSGRNTLGSLESHSQSSLLTKVSLSSHRLYPISSLSSRSRSRLGVSSLNVVPKINMGRISTETHQFDFSEASKALMSLTEDFDDFFTDNFIPLHAFMYFIMSFEHLMFDQSLLVNDELDLLNDSVVSSEPRTEVEALDTEVTEMHKDYQLLKRLPKVVSVGVFKVDVSDITSSICKNVESCMTEIFNTHIYSKMSKLLSENKQKTENLKKQLRQTAPNIEAYIELKSFLEGDDLLAIIRNIGSDIKLCRQLNNFEEKFNIKSFELFNEYMESLTWVNELEVLHESGLKRLRDALAKVLPRNSKENRGLVRGIRKRNGQH